MTNAATVRADKPARSRRARRPSPHAHGAHRSPALLVLPGAAPGPGRDPDPGPPLPTEEDPPLPAADPRPDGADELLGRLRRRDLHYLDEAAAIAELLRTGAYGRESLAGRLGRSLSSLSNKLRLLRLSPACQRILRESGLTERHARCLLRLEDDEDRIDAVRCMARRDMTVAQAERYVRELLDPPPRRGRRIFVLKDVRLFLNSLDRDLDLVRQAGVDVQSRRLDTDDAILLAYRIPKRPRRDGPVSFQKME